MEAVIPGYHQIVAEHRIFGVLPEFGYTCAMRRRGGRAGGGGETARVEHTYTRCARTTPRSKGTLLPLPTMQQPPVVKR